MRGCQMYIILVYDISLENGGSKIWRDTYKICKKYLSHVQNSVFEGEISESQLFELKKQLSKTIRKDMDSLILFKSRNERWLEKDILGVDIRATDRFI